MPWSPRSGRRPRTWRSALSALLLIAVLLGLPGIASAAPAGAASAPAPMKTGHPATTPANAGAHGTASPPPATPAPAQTNPSGNQPPASSADDTELLGGRDPLCDDPGALDADAQQNCARSGEPQSLQPIGNYSLDQHINTGWTGFGNFFPNVLQSVIGFVFGLIEHIVSLALLAVSLAFGFSLYRSDHTGQIPHRLGSVEHFFTSPLLQVAVLAAGVWLIWQMVVGQRHGRAIGGLVAMTLMLLVTLFLLQDPRGTIGRFDTFTNDVAQFAVGAFSGHPSSTHPTSSYADATEGLWQTMGEEPWCAMEFGDVSWCMAPMDPAMRKDLPKLEAALASKSSHGQNTDGNGAPEPQPLQNQELALLKACLSRGESGPHACTNGELFLAFPPNDDARNGQNDSWTLFHTLGADQPALTQIRGPGGAGNRLIALVLTAVGMVFFLLLLIYIALNLLIAGILLIVLLMFAGIIAIVCAFGDWGREKWLEWAGMTIGALAIKILFALYLGVLIGASELMRAIGEQMGNGWLDQWILFAALWMLAFAFRRKLMGLFSPERAHHEHHRGLGSSAAALPALAAARAGANSGRATGRAIGRGGRYLYDRHRDAREEQRWLGAHAAHQNAEAEQAAARAALAEGASDRLNERAGRMLDARYREASRRVKRGARKERQAAALQQRGTALRNERLSGGFSTATGQASPAARARDAHLLAEEQHAFAQSEQIRDALRTDSELAEARRFVSAAEEHRRQTGHRWSESQLADARAAVEREAESEKGDRDYRHLAYRLGEDGRERWKRVQGDDQQRAALKAQIDAQLETDRQDLAVVRHARLPAPRPPAPPPIKRRQPHRYRQYGEFLGLERHVRRPE